MVVRGLSHRVLAAGRGAACRERRTDGCHVVTSNAGGTGSAALACARGTARARLQQLVLLLDVHRRPAWSWCRPAAQVERLLWSDHGSAPARGRRPTSHPRGTENGAERLLQRSSISSHRRARKQRQRELQYRHDSSRSTPHRRLERFRAQGSLLDLRGTTPRTGGRSVGTWRSGKSGFHSLSGKRRPSSSAISATLWFLSTTPRSEGWCCPNRAPPRHPAIRRSTISRLRFP